MYVSNYCPFACSNAPINVFPHHPPSGLSGALVGELTQKYCPTMGHLTKT